METKARVIAFYLPQFHPTEVNNHFWGKGFTEWTNVGKAKPLYKGHKQPRVPTDLGYYDLRLPSVREEQAQMAHEAGIEGFMYWHYWFGNGETVLDMPYREILRLGKPDYPFCLGWANHSWSTRTWLDKKTGKMGNKDIFHQGYYGIEDYKKHFDYVLPAFKDQRYIRINGKPLFYIFSPITIDDWDSFSDLWNELALKHGLPGIHFVLSNKDDDRKIKTIEGMRNASGFAISHLERAMIETRGKFGFKLRAFFQDRFYKSLGLDKYDYEKVCHYLIDETTKKTNYYPIIIPQLDSSPRRGTKGTILAGATPKKFELLLQEAIKNVSAKDPEDRIIFLRSWNEWGEGNYVEPDIEFEHGFLDVLQRNIIIQ